MDPKSFESKADESHRTNSKFSPEEDIKDQITLSINQTLYVKEINPKLPINEAKKELFFLFSMYGTILEIRMKASERLKG